MGSFKWRFRGKNKQTCRGKQKNRNRIGMMYKKLLHYAGFEEHWSFLFENDLLAYRKYERRYRLTERGLRFLQLYIELRKMVSGTQTQGTREKESLGVYEWPYRVANLTGIDERPSPYDFI